MKKDSLTLNFNNEEGQVNPSFEDEGATPEKEPPKVGKIQPIEGSDEPTREQWANPVEFLLSCIAMSVGLGNVWRFPFTAYENGGGAFLIPYIIILIFVGKPLYYMELCMGQFASFGSVKVWAMVPGFKGVGYGQAVATWCVVTYYVSLMALTVFYFFASFFPTLPWASCGDYENCFDKDTNMSGKHIKHLKPASEIYFEREVLHYHEHGLDDGIFAPDWKLTLCLLLSWVLLFFVLVKGVKSSGKSAYFTALFPYFVLFILLIRGATLPGAVDGIIYFIRPEWHKLLEPEVWFKAVGQSFFSLSVGFGSIIMFSSYNDFRHNVYRDAAIISITDTLTSLLAGFTIFAILGHLATEAGLSVDEVVKGGGSGLAFISYPDVLARFDWVPQLFAVLFFLMLFTLGVGSASALTGCIITIICDEFPEFKKSWVTLAVCASGFLLGLVYVTPQGQFILDLVDHYGGNFVIYILALLEVIAVQWIYGLKNFIRDIEFMLGRKTGFYWRFCWALFIPVLLFVILLYTMASQKALKRGDYIFGPGAHVFGSLIALLALICLPILLVRTYLSLKDNYPDNWQTLKNCYKNSEEWCPKGPGLRQNYQQFVEERNKSKYKPIEEYLEITEPNVLVKPWFLFKRMVKDFWLFLKEVFIED